MLVASSWKTISVPGTSFNADIMLLLTDGSVLVHNGWVPPGPLSNSKQWLRLTPDNRGNYETGTWLTGLDMQYDSLHPGGWPLLAAQQRRHLPADPTPDPSLRSG
jgi:hypothetical protein